MRVAIHQPEHLGYLGFYNKMMNADAWVFLDNVQMARRDYVRRNRILGPNGPMWLSVPVLTKGRYYQEIKDVEINQTQGWRGSHWKSVYHQYRRAPYFERYADELKAIYETEWRLLSELNIALAKLMASWLGLERPMYRASEMGIDGNSSQLLADLTQAVGGEEYLSGPMGRDYLDESLFHARDLRIAFNDFEHPAYPQSGANGEFVPYLAAIDLLFNCGPTSLDVIAEGGTR